VKEKLEVVSCIKNGESKSSIKRQCGIPEGLLCGWLDDEAGLGRKQIHLDKHITLDECLYVWYLQKCSEGLLSTAALKQQAEKLQGELDGRREFKDSDGWLWC